MNFKVRLKNKAFWVACAGLIILILQYLQSFMGDINLNLELLKQIMDAIVICAVALGILVDPTTPTISDAPPSTTKVKQNGKS
ncbi:holin, phage phi LC3 family [Eubacterium aggregans]|uniref:Holin, phage phi LC3 family n=1 Tax=Eubacterium aggregans TaxID=81409 RepID=A0A1H4DKG4_9FIRM|nr:phage holin [Eubacterium aggregans]MDD4508427.1 phage holin [Eubacteriaceae bacterium]SEA73204.1 holin, phage phi LC3 family [Eubacterium aggregans]